MFMRKFLIYCKDRNLMRDFLKNLDYCVETINLRNAAPLFIMQNTQKPASLSAPVGR